MNQNEKEQNKTDNDDNECLYWIKKNKQSVGGWKYIYSKIEQIILNK